MKDMTKGNPLKLIVLFALPMVASSLLQQCYNLADSVIAGRFAGVNALAAIGVSTPITQLFVNLGVGASMGCSVVISQLFGAGEMKKLKTSIYTAMIAFIALSLVLMTVGSVFAGPIAKLLKTPDDLYKDALSYLRIYMFGIPFLFLYNISNSVFNALGDSRKPLYFLIFSTCLNILLDVVFVIHFKRGVVGVAWATFIAQGMAGLLAASVLLMKVRKLEKKVAVFDWNLLGGMSKVGIPTMIQNAIVNIGNLFVAALVNTNGAEFIAGYSAALKINGFFMMVIVTIGNAIATFSAQNIGAGQYDRPKKGLIAGMAINYVYVFLAIILVYTCGHGLVGLFLDEPATEAVYAAGVGYLRVVTVASLAFILLNNCCAVCRAAGYMIAFTSTTLVDLVIRVVTAYAFNGVMGSASIYWSVAFGWIVGAVMGVWFFAAGRWKKVRLLKKG